MKQFILVVLMASFPLTFIKADVIFVPHEEFGTAFSLELIASYELRLTKYNTVNFWGGFGAVSMAREISHPAYGAEMAIEFRQYFRANSFKNFNIGLYAGFAYMKHPYFYMDHHSGYMSSVGFVPGLKVTYKKRINSWLVGEPYVGVSTPWYDRNFKELFSRNSRIEPPLILTFGVRIGFNRVWR